MEGSEYRIQHTMVTWIYLFPENGWRTDLARAQMRKNAGAPGFEENGRVSATGRTLSLGQIFCHFRRRLFMTTETELRAMAAPAIMGLRRNPLRGNRTPAAMGMPMTL
jgi:hypothetical protein